MPDWLTAPVAALLAAAAAVGVVAFGGVKELVAAWLAVRKARVVRRERDVERAERAERQRDIERRYGDGFGRMLEYHQSFVELRDVTAADRVVILRAFDDGGLPRPGEPYHVRAQAAWSRDGRDVMSRYNFDLPVDAAYTAMVQDVASKGVVTLTTATMPECVLRGFYEEEGVVQAILYRLHLNECRFLFVSVASYSAEFTKKQQADIARRVHRMAALIDASEGDGTDLHRPLA